MEKRGMGSYVAVASRKKTSPGIGNSPGLAVRAGQGTRLAGVRVENGVMNTLLCPLILLDFHFLRFHARAAFQTAAIADHHPVAEIQAAHDFDVVGGL